MGTATTDTTREAAAVAARRLAAPLLREGFVSESIHVYRDEAGSALYYKMRLRHPVTGEKEIRPFHWNGTAFVLGEPSFRGAKAIYNLPALAKNPGAPVVVVEGETCVSALSKIGVLATTSGGADSAGRADWGPLAGRTVTTWPDNDEPGARYADAVEGKARPLGCTVRRVDVAALELPPKGDCVDWLAEHRNATAADVAALPLVAARTLPDKVASDAMLETISLADLLVADLGSGVAWLVDGLIPVQGCGFIAGAPKSAKSWLALDLAVAAASGGRFLDRAVLEADRSVLYIAGEGGPVPIRNRFSWLCAGRGLDPADIGTKIQIALAPRLSLDKEEDVDRLRARLEAMNPAPRVVVLDPLMRRSEVLNLRWSQVEFRDDDRAVVRLASSDTKSKKPREITLTMRASAALAELHGDRAKKKIGAVFVNEKTRKSWNTIQKKFDRARRAAGLASLHFHDLRRSYITNARRRGVAESVIMRISGHKTRNVFERYNIVNDDDVQNAVLVIEAGQERERQSLDDGKVLVRFGVAGAEAEAVANG